MKNSLVCLGAIDPEMKSIRYMLDRHGYQSVAVATADGKRCSKKNAYNGHAFEADVSPDTPRIWVECRTPDYNPDRDIIVDHHHAGDPGYDAPPEEYWLGSSIGQVAQLIGAQMTPYNKLAAASDHCLSAAMRGECGDICPGDLMNWRVRVRSAMQQAAPWALRRRIQRAIERIETLPKLNFGGEQFIDASFDTTPELRDAAAFACQPIITTRVCHRGIVKIGLYGARPAVTASWLEVMGNADVAAHSYGNPFREYAGIVLDAEASRQLLCGRSFHAQ